MSEAGPLASLLVALSAACEWLRARDVPFAVVGGVAASLHGRPRLTKDVDFVALVDESAWPSLLGCAHEHGLEPRGADVLEFARISRVMLMRHRSSGIEIDVSLGALPFERELVERARQCTIDGVSFALATPEDVIVMKAIAMRPRDQTDIEGILKTQTGLDLPRVRGLVAEFSAALEAEDLEAELERLIIRGRRT